MAHLASKQAVMRIAVYLLVVLFIAGFAGAAKISSAADASSPVYVVPVKQTIESGLQSFLERAFLEAKQAGAKQIVLEIDTFGGRVDSAEDIGKLIRDSSIPTVAFVRGKAVSAGSYIALNANRIVMEPGSSLGASAVVDLSGTEIDNPKIVSHWASEMRAAAELRGRNPLIAEGMVDKNAVVRLPQINKTFEKGQIVSLTADEAVKVGYADAVASDLDGVLAFIGEKGSPTMQVEPTVSEKMARLLTNPVVMTILLLIGMAGVAIEVFVPGFGLPGILGIAAFVLYFFGHYVAGFAGVEDVILFVAGIVLLVIEVFVPSFGILGILGIASIVSGVVMAAYDTGNAAKSLSIAVVLAAVAVGIFIKYFKHRGVWNKFILRDQLTSESGYVSHASKEQFLGKTGVTATPLRPAGTVIIDDERVDVVADGEFISVGKRVEVHRVEGTRILVREMKVH